MGTVRSKEKWDCTRYLNGTRTLPPAEGKAGGEREDLAPSPLSSKVTGRTEGDQPQGKMRWAVLPSSLPGYPHCGTIKIDYTFTDGIQMERNPNPGKPFCGIGAVAYLPDDSEGNQVLRLLERAFEQKLLFTVDSDGSGAEIVAWADVSHKTLASGGPESISYPDPDYLKDVKRVLKAKGIE
ncbi:E3 ubiquitin-protein ligase DTX3L1 [Megalops cyprinoides]|uniref:E3 ubiquitin-protein ligase DTX3L1 n=1 Tax=Megalops cyprinoides TaxID=118141 RepID=UPI001864A64D|nr:E3 ubiquitin-protein ligase DTX3L1 [Megalops cyprinoides]XP_036378459.1 E3 ubiquitin-protein ligase DTX3L1 [Megalops cyprinoides]XP_036378460.1 E3 ubiquitin-protein ligase DTX3L1 [Megalops cyprinoides]